MDSASEERKSHLVAMVPRMQKKAFTIIMKSYVSSPPCLLCSSNRGEPVHLSTLEKTLRLPTRMNALDFLEENGHTVEEEKVVKL